MGRLDFNLYSPAPGASAGAPVVLGRLLGRRRLLLLLLLLLLLRLLRLLMRLPRRPLRR